MKRIIAALTSMALVIGLAGCSTSETDQDQQSSSDKTIEEQLRFTDRDRDPSYDEASATKIMLDGSGASVTGEGTTADGSTVTISADGTYVVSGTLADGQVVVNLPGADDKAQIVLDGVTIHNEDGPAIQIDQADKVFLTLAEGSTNVLSDGASYALAEEEDEPYAALYSKDRQLPPCHRLQGRHGHHRRHHRHHERRGCRAWKRRHQDWRRRHNRERGG